MGMRRNCNTTLPKNWFKVNATKVAHWRAMKLIKYREHGIPFVKDQK